MAKYLVSFPASAMEHLDADGLQAASAASHAVVDDAKAAGVWVFGGAINEDVAPVRVDDVGNVADDTYPQTAKLNGGYTILEVPSRDEALGWATRFAVACQCAQEVREFHYDAAS